jgi:Mce-associated membrane protein
VSTQDAVEPDLTGDQPATAADGEADAGAPPVRAEPGAPPVRAGLAGRVRGLPRRSVSRAGRLPQRWRITSMAALAVLTAGAAAAAVSLGLRAGQDDAVAAARTAALAAARTEIRQILSYDYRRIGADLARARGDTTGEFRGEFQLLASQLIRPAATAQHTITWATVPGAAVVSATPDRVVVLLFIDQDTASRAAPQPQQVGSQVRVTMQRVAGRWLIAQFRAL